MKNNLSALILTGGLGTRLRPLTLDTPKPLLPIGNTPFLSYPCALLRQHRVHHAILCTAQSPIPYRKFITNQKKTGTKVLCSKETQLLGTAGALKNAERFIHSSPFFILNGDVLTDANLSELIRFHRSKKALITLALIQVNNPQSFGLVFTNPSGKITKFLEKPSLEQLDGQKEFFINAGIYLFEKEIFNLIPANKNYSTERELFPDCLNKNLPCYGFKLNSTTHWIDIGTPEKFIEANQFATSSNRSWNRINPTKHGKSNKIHSSSAIHNDVIIGNHCTIGAGCEIKNSVLLNGIKIANNTTIENCIIGNFVSIGNSCAIKNVKILGDRSILTDYSKL